MGRETLKSTVQGKIPATTKKDIYGQLSKFVKEMKTSPSFSWMSSELKQIYQLVENKLQNDFESIDSKITMCIGMTVKFLDHDWRYLAKPVAESSSQNTGGTIKFDKPKPISLPSIVVPKFGKWSKRSTINGEKPITSDKPRFINDQQTSIVNASSVELLSIMIESVEKYNYDLYK